MGLRLPKQLLPFAGATVIEHLVDLFQGLPLYIAAPKEHLDQFRTLLGERVCLIKGGETRFQSVKNAFDAIPNLEDEDLVLIHDAARPFLKAKALESAWSFAAERDAVIFAAKAVDTIKRVGSDGIIAKTLDRDYIYHAQTPQIFRARLLRRGYAAMDPRRAAPTDEAMLLEWAGIPVSIFPTDHSNQKLTNPEDLALLEHSDFRTGHGYDVHRFDKSRPLYLGGVFIEEGPGLLGHSDADVAIHALIDALLGAAGEGDIGQWFPDTDSSYKGARSIDLLDHVYQSLLQKGFCLVNADITIQAQIPKLAPYIPDMRLCLAKILGAGSANVNIKATTTEGMGFVGRKEGMAADAVVLLRRGAAKPRT